MERPPLTTAQQSLAESYMPMARAAAQMYTAGRRHRFEDYEAEFYHALCLAAQEHRPTLDAEGIDTHRHHFVKRARLRFIDAARAIKENDMKRGLCGHGLGDARRPLGMLALYVVMKHEVKEDPDPPPDFEEEEAFYRTLGTLGRCSDRVRLAFRMRFIEGLEFKEIGKRLGCGEARAHQVVGGRIAAYRAAA